MAGEWPLVGRSGELDLVGQMVRSTDRWGLVLAGPAGVGKTRLATECLLQAEDAGQSVESRAFFAWLLTKITELRGQPDQTIPFGREGTALLRQLGRKPFAAACQAYVVAALAHQGKTEAAEAELAALEAFSLPAMWTVVDYFAAQAWLTAARGDTPAACSQLEDAVNLGSINGDRFGTAMCLRALARLGRPGDAAARLDELAKQVEGELVPAMAAHTRALADGNASGLSEVAAAFEAMGAGLLAAEAAADAGLVR